MALGIIGRDYKNYYYHKIGVYPEDTEYQGSCGTGVVTGVFGLRLTGLPRSLVRLVVDN